VGKAEHHGDVVRMRISRTSKRETEAVVVLGLALGPGHLVRAALRLVLEHHLGYLKEGAIDLEVFLRGGFVGMLVDRLR
jgi:hypothetical protein